MMSVWPVKETSTWRGALGGQAERTVGQCTCVCMFMYICSGTQNGYSYMYRYSVVNRPRGMYM